MKRTNEHIFIPRIPVSVSIPEAELEMLGKLKDFYKCQKTSELINILLESIDMIEEKDGDNK